MGSFFRGIQLFFQAVMKLLGLRKINREVSAINAGEVRGVKGAPSGISEKSEGGSTGTVGETGVEKKKLDVKGNAKGKSKSAKVAAAASVEPPWRMEEQFVVPVKEGETRFHDLGLDNRIMRAIADLGFSYCTPIQSQSLPIALKGEDVIGKAQTGTGKTAAFLLAILQQQLDNPIPRDQRYSSEPRALVIAPTRELAFQIEKDAVELSKYTGLRVFSVVGGMDYQKQKDVIFNEVVDILIATPGRLIDFLNSKDVFLDQVEILVIDEADRMLDMGFIPDVKRIIRQTPATGQRQTLLFSATFNQDVLNLSERWTNNPKWVEIVALEQTTDRVNQKVYLVSSEEKLTVIRNYIRQNKVERAIVFANRRDETRRLQEILEKLGVRCALLSGEVPQNKRMKTLEQFKEGKIDVLVATDVAGRGIHVDGLSHVFNFNLPEDPEDYVHRIGRTGRAGSSGESISFACEDEAFLLPEIEAHIGKKLDCIYPDAALLAR